MVGIHSNLCGQIERDGQSLLTSRKKVSIAVVGFESTSKAGILPRGPQPPAVHGGINAAREWKFAWVAEIAFGIPILQAVLRDYGFHGKAGRRGELSLR